MYRINWDLAQRDFFRAGSVDYHVLDERGRFVGHRVIVREAAPSDHMDLAVKFVINTHITRNGITFGAIRDDKPLKAQTLEEAMKEAEAIINRMSSKTIKAMEKRRTKAGG